MTGFLRIATTPSVAEVQRQLGSQAFMSEWMAGDEFSGLTEREAEFIRARNSFFIATVGTSGWPYVQHRGGPTGFLRVVDQQTLGFADFRGNRQYVTAGNLNAQSRAALILMDYPNRRRLKIYARTAILPGGDPELVQAFAIPGYEAQVERLILLKVAAFDWNCSQHIPPGV